MSNENTSKPARVLLIGWDAADWNVINPLIEKGEMPTLASLIDRGVSGELETLYPALSPMLWTSIATGKRPYKHGIHGFTEPNPHGPGIRPVTNVSRKTKALWNILQQNDRKSVVVGWWPSHPAEPIDGVMVSEHYHLATSVDPDEAWQMPAGVVHPTRLREKLAELRFHPGELLPEHILPFVPKAAQIDQDKDKRLNLLAKTLAECITINSAATALIQNEPWDFMGVYFDAIDHFSHLFMRYHPPRQEWIDESDFDLYHDVVNGAYRFHDMMLEALLSQVDDDTTVMLISDHGFHPDHLRPREIPDEPAGPATEHSPFGIFVMAGPGIARGEKVQGANLLDIAPTILQAFGLPVGEDMDGRILRSVFTEPEFIEPIPSWDDVSGECGMHSSDFVLDPQESQEALQQLIALGYIEDPGEKASEAVATTNRELQYNLARSFMDGNRHIDAIPILQESWDCWPKESRFGVQLIQCFVALEQATEARTALATLIERKQDLITTATKELEELVKQLQGAENDEPDEEQSARLRKLRAQATINPYAAKMLEGSVFSAEENFEQALTCFKEAEPFASQRPDVYLQMGRALRELERFEAAEQQFNKALEFDPRNPGAYLGLCRCQLKLDRLDEAEQSARTSLSYRYQNPWGHYFLAAALLRNRRFHAAVEALEIATAQNPNFPEAHAVLEDLYSGPLRNLEKHALHQRLRENAEARVAMLREGRLQALEETDSPRVKAFEPHEPLKSVAIDPGTQEANPNDIITVVCGLPRSGTSMMMNMLEAAGLEILTDGQREADEDNPRGYFEFLPAAQLRTDASWVPDAKGKAVKIVAQLLRFLPSDQKYRFILLDRSLDEVLASQEKMLRRSGKWDDGTGTEGIKRAFQQQLQNTQRFLGRISSPVMTVPFSQCITDPLTVAEQLRDFLDVESDAETIAARVDSQLYRNRKTPSPTM